MPIDININPGPTPGQQVVSGLQAFSDSVNQLAMRQSLQGAQSQIDAINDHVKDEFERHQAYRQVGQQLAFQLAGAGADSTKINTLMEAIPKANPLPQNALQASVSEDPSVRSRAKSFEQTQQSNVMEKEKLESATKIKVAEIAAGAKQAAADRQKGVREEADFLRLGDTMARQKDISPLLEERAPLVKARNLLAEGKDINAALEMVKTFMARASGETRVSDEDVKRLSGNPDLKSAIRRYSSLSAKGVLPEEDRLNLLKIVEALETSNRTLLESKVDAFAESRAKGGSGRYSFAQYRDVARTRAGLAPPDQKTAEQPAQQQQQQQTASTQRPWLIK